MAETLTYDPTPATEVLTEEEQDSLAVGEKMQAEQEQLLAGKYKNAEELENAYVELEKKLGQSKEEEPKAEAEPETKETDTNVDILERLWTEAQDNKVQQETVDQLKDMDPTELAKMHLNYRQKNAPRDLTEKDMDALKGVVGGEANYTSMMQWAQSNLKDKEIDMFDSVMDLGNPLAAFFAVRALAYRYQDAVGRDGKMVTGRAPKQSSSQYRSQAEVVQAMSDPRYENDPAYRQDIMDKLSRSTVKF